MNIIVLYAVIVLNTTNIVVMPIMDFRGSLRPVDSCNATARRLTEEDVFKPPFYVCVEEYIENGI